MAGVSAVFALISGSLQQEIAAVRAHHDLVELARDKLVPIHLVYFTRTHAHGALTAQLPSIQRTSADIFLD